MKTTLNFFCVILLISIALTVNMVADETESQIGYINKKVKEIESNISKGEYPFIKLDNIVRELESVPPKLSFYYDSSTHNIVSVKIVVGHESWSKSFSYYYDQEENIIKYLEVYDRFDNPPKRTIIYGSENRIIWKNIDKPVVDPDDMKNFCKKAIYFQIEFSKY